MQPWKTLTRQTIFTQLPYVVLEQHTVQLPDGRIIPDWMWIITPDYVNVVATAEQNTVLCFRQTKYGVDGTSLAPVGGYIDAGETPLDAAKRELREETGYEATTWASLGQYRVDANRGAGTGHFFLASHARKVTDAAADDLEEQELLHLSRVEIEQALANGEFKVLSWAAIIALALIKMSK